MSRLLLFVLVAAMVTSSCAALADIASEDVNQLEEGDCFDLGDLPDEIGRVQKRPCFGADAAHVAGWVDFSDEREYPEMRWFNGVLANKCNRLMDDKSFGFNVSEVWIGWLVPTEQAWASGRRQALCYYTEA